jgi:hypothetical protein
MLNAVPLSCVKVKLPLTTIVPDVAAFCTPIPVIHPLSRKHHRQHQPNMTSQIVQCKLQLKSIPQ